MGPEYGGVCIIVSAAEAKIGGGGKEGTRATKMVLSSFVLLTMHNMAPM